MAAGGAVGSGMTEAIPQEGVEPLTPPLQATASLRPTSVFSKTWTFIASVSDDRRPPSVSFQASQNAARMACSLRW